MKKQSFIGFYTLVVREVVRIIRIWPQTLLPPLITMTLYFMIFGSLIGDKIGNISGVPYVDFIAPGLIMMSIITNSYANVSSSFFNGKFQRHLEEMYVSTMSTNAIMFGYVLGGVVRGLMVAVVVTLVSLFFTNVSVIHISLMLFIAFLTSLLFSFAGLLNGVFARKFDDVSIIPTFVLTPFTYLGGVFYSINMLNPFWQKLSHLNPILYMVNGFRFSMLNTSDININNSIMIILLFIIALYCTCFYLIKNGFGIKT